MTELIEAEREALAARIYAERDSLPSRRNRYHPNPLTREDADHLARVILASEYVAAARAADAHAAGVAEGRAEVAAAVEGHYCSPNPAHCKCGWKADVSGRFRADYVPVLQQYARHVAAALAGTSPQGEGER